MSLGDRINLERVKIVEEAKDFYKVQYKGQEYRVMKSAETHFANGSASAPSLRQAIRLEQILIPEAGIFQDTEVPNEFKEIMMFHEIRESEYKNAGFADGHERAVNDEVLYALKFFTPKQRTAYFKFAEEYRAKQAELPMVRLDEDVHNMGLSLFYRDKQEPERIGEGTGVQLVVLDGMSHQQVTDFGKTMEKECNLSPYWHVGKSGVPLRIVISNSIKWYITEHGHSVLLVDKDQTRLAYLSRIPGVVPIDAREPNVEKRVYETYKRLMKKPKEQ